MKKVDQMADEKRYLMNNLLNEVTGRGNQFFIQEKQQTAPFFSASDWNFGQTCCFSGHRPEKLHHEKGVYISRLMGAILNSIETGHTIYISGMARGIDLWAAEAVWAIQRIYPEIRLICAVPYRGFERGWPTDDISLYRWVLEVSDHIEVISGQYHSSVFQKRNMWMVDHSEALIAVSEGACGGTQNTLRYARRQSKRILLL